MLNTKLIDCVAQGDLDDTSKRDLLLEIQRISVDTQNTTMVDHLRKYGIDF